MMCPFRLIPGPSKPETFDFVVTTRLLLPAKVTGPKGSASLRSGLEIDAPQPAGIAPGLRATVILPSPRDGKLGLRVLFGSLLFLYFQLFIPPFTPIWTGGDSMIWLHDAHRMLDGDALYRDFLQITLPGTDILYFAAFKLFGARMWLPNAFLMLAGTLLTWLIYQIARSVQMGESAVLPSLLFLTLVFRDRLDATHHWFSMLAMMAAIAVVIDSRSPRRIAISGALCGLAACFTQSLGLMALLALLVFLYWEGRNTSMNWRQQARRQLIAMAPFGAVILLTSGYFAWNAGLSRFLYCTVLFNLRYYPSLGVPSSWRGYMTGLPGVLHWPEAPHLFGFLLIHGLIPLIFLLFFVRFYRRPARRSPSSGPSDWDSLLLINLFGLFAFLSVAAAPTWARLYYVSPVALIVFAWFLKSQGSTSHLFSRALQLLGLTLLFILPVTRQLHARAYLDLPSGRTAFFDRNVHDHYQWVMSRARPKDFIFGGYFPDFYFSLDLRNPGPVPYVTPYDYTRPEEVQALLNGLELHHVKIVLWTPDLDLPDNSNGDHLGALRFYLRAHYRVASESPDFEAWLRVD
jgi:hypothetical protein